MIELNEKEAEIAKELRVLDSLLGQFAPGRQGEAQARAIRTNIEILRDDIEYFELTLETLDGDKSALQRLLAGFKASLAEVEARFAKKGGPAAARAAEFSAAEELARVNVYDMSKLQLFDLGDGLLDQALAKLQRVNRSLAEDQRVVDAANEGLLAQAERLDRLNEKLEDTRSVLGQAGGLISDLVNDFYKDKFLMGLGALILILFIAVAVVGVVKKSKKGSTSAGTAGNSTSSSSNSTANATAAAAWPWEGEGETRLPLLRGEAG